MTRYYLFQSSIVVVTNDTTPPLTNLNSKKHNDAFIYTNRDRYMMTPTKTLS